MAVAFFDLDLTLLEMNTASLWLRRELRLGHMSRSFFMRSAFHVGLYQLGVARMEEVLEKALRTVEGVEEAAVRERTLAFWHEEVRGRFRAGGLEVLRAHQARGERCVLLSSTSPYLSEPVAEELGLDDVLCTRFEVEGGRFTGRCEGPLCYGDGKRLKAESWAREHGVDLSDCSFYTDSFSDLPALVVMGRPVCVHPDPRLRRHAERQGWEIAIWGGAAPVEARRAASGR